MESRNRGIAVEKHEAIFLVNLLMRVSCDIQIVLDHFEGPKYNTTDGVQCLLQYIGRVGAEAWGNGSWPNY